jgi:Family of unknown function (DUF6464)
MLETGLILTIALLPFLISLLAARRQERQARLRLQTALNAATAQSFQRLHVTLSTNYAPGETGAYFLGDSTCRFNAQSAFLRCAVNPCGSCPDCSSYEARDGAGSGNPERSSPPPL